MSRYIPIAPDYGDYSEDEMPTETPAEAAARERAESLLRSANGFLYTAKQYVRLQSRATPSVITLNKFCTDKVSERVSSYNAIGAGNLSLVYTRNQARCMYCASEHIAQSVSTAYPQFDWVIARQPSVGTTWTSGTLVSC
jgi:5-methylcytosine-specific restriction endonuclease McrA